MEAHFESPQSVLGAQTKALNELCIMSLADCSGKIIAANNLFCKISGYSIEELLGKPHSIINSGYHDKDFFKEMWEKISSGLIWRGEICNQAKGGSLYWVDSTIVPVFNALNEVEQYISIRYDITQRKIVESSLTRSFKLATLGAVSGFFAHEIKKPLSIIVDKTSSLLNQFETNNLTQLKIKDDLTRINKTANQITRIVNGIDTLAHDENSEASVEVCISSILLETVELCKNKLNNSRILIKTEGDLDSILECRPVQISQALLNLISNAIDAIENLKTRWIVVHINNKENHIELSVTDSGNGINSEILDKIMNPFFTTKDVGDGAGLGLSISKKIIESHNGSLKYDPFSTNTRFNIELPKKI